MFCNIFSERKVFKPLNILIMKKIKFIQIATSLGIVIPACLMSFADKCEASESADMSKISPDIIMDEKNPVKDKIINSFSSEEQTPPTQLVHTNVHANFTVSHTNHHANFGHNSEHTNQHDNTPAKHTNQHSNSNF